MRASLALLIKSTQLDYPTPIDVTSLDTRQHFTSRVMVTRVVLSFDTRQLELEHYIQASFVVATLSFSAERSERHQNAVETSFLAVLL